MAPFFQIATRWQKALVAQAFYMGEEVETLAKMSQIFFPILLVALAGEMSLGWDCLLEASDSME